MALFDVLGMKKDFPKDAGDEAADAGIGAPPPDVPEPARPAPAKRGAGLWRALLILDALFILACLGLAGWRVFAALSAPQIVAAPARPAPEKKEEPAPAKEEAPAPAPEAEEKAPPETAPEPPKPAPAPEPEKKAPAKPKPAEPAEAASAGVSGATVRPGSPDKTTRPVTFEHAAPGAKEVYLSGYFLVRTGGRKEMFEGREGVWRATVYLNTGQDYKYRFEVIGKDGKRRTTPMQTVEVK